MTTLGRLDDLKAALTAAEKRAEEAEARAGRLAKWIELWGHNSTQPCLTTEGHPPYACDCEVREVLADLESATACKDDGFHNGECDETCTPAAECTCHRSDSPNCAAHPAPPGPKLPMSEATQPASKWWDTPELRKHFEPTHPGPVAGPGAGKDYATQTDRERLEGAQEALAKQGTELSSLRAERDALKRENEELWRRYKALEDRHVAHLETTKDVLGQSIGKSAELQRRLEGCAAHARRILEDASRLSVSDFRNEMRALIEGAALTAGRGK